jgi:hypothetical protein
MHIKVFIGMSLVAAILGFAHAAIGDELSCPAEDKLSFPEGIACPEFGLCIEIGESHQVFREFTDRNGNVVRILAAGKGAPLLFSTDSNDAALASKANGAVTSITNNPDGTQTWVLTGHNVVILFPTDQPPGPSTTLHVGRVVFTVDASGTFVLQAVSGQTIDICAALSE